MSVLDPVDESFLTSARHRVVLDLRLRATADEVWAGLTAPRPLAWCRALSATWTSPEPYGVGTTRSVVVAKVATLHERYFLWDDDLRRHAFFVERSSAPLFRAFAEDYRVESAGGGCRFTWTFAFEGSRRTAPLVLAGLPLNRALFASFARDTRRHFGAAS